MLGNARPGPGYLLEHVLGWDPGLGDPPIAHSLCQLHRHDDHYVMNNVSTVIPAAVERFLGGLCTTPRPPAFRGRRE